MDGKPCLMLLRAYLLPLAWSVDGSAGHVMRVLEGDQAGLSPVIDSGANRGTHQVPAQDAVFSMDRAGQNAADGRHRGHFIVIDMTPFLGDHFLSRTRVQANGNLVPHGT